MPEGRSTTGTGKDTVKQALCESVARLRRARALARLVELGEAGAFDELLRKDAYRPGPPRSVA